MLNVSSRLGAEGGGCGSVELLAEGLRLGRGGRSVGVALLYKRNQTITQCICTCK